MTPKQRRFVSEYMIDHNSSRAAAAAGYSERTAKAQGSRLLTNVDIAAAVNAAQQASLQRTETIADEILTDLNSLRKASITDILTENFALKPPSEWGDTWLRLKIAGIEVEQKMVRSTDGVQAGESRSWDKSDTRVIKIRFVDPIKSIQLLGTHIGVKAFPGPEIRNETHVHLHAQITEKLQGALARRERLIEAEPVTRSNS